MKLFSNKVDAFYSDFGFIDTVSFVVGVSEVEFQRTQISVSG